MIVSKKAVVLLTISAFTLSGVASSNAMTFSMSKTVVLHQEIVNNTGATNTLFWRKKEDPKADPKKDLKRDDKSKDLEKGTTVGLFTSILIAIGLSKGVDDEKGDSWW